MSKSSLGLEICKSLIYEQRSLVGCSPWGCEESDTTERLHFQLSLSCFGEGNGNPLQCSCLENPKDERAWWAVVYGVTQSWTRLKQQSNVWFSMRPSRRRLRVGIKRPKEIEMIAVSKSKWDHSLNGENSPERGKQHYQDTKSSNLVAEGQNWIRSLGLHYIRSGN